MSLYDYSDYREALKWAAERWKGSSAGRTYQRLAKASGVHPPYLSNVLKEKAHLNSDQLFAAFKHMGFTTQETDYVLLLQEQDKCVLEGRKKALQTQLNRIRKEQGKTESHIDVEVMAPREDNLSRYYLDTSIKMVYGFLGLEKYASQPELIARALNFREQTVVEAINYLIEVGMIEKGSNGNLKKSKTKMHLSKDSHLFDAHEKLFLFRCLEHQDRNRNDSDYSFLLTFTGNSEVKSQIKEKFLSFLEEIQPLVEEAEPEEVYQMNFNLFNWS